jgi:hypothetical protein
VQELDVGGRSFELASTVCVAFSETDVRRATTIVRRLSEEMKGR